MGKRIRFQDIRAGKTAYRVCMGSISKIQFTSRPYIEKGSSLGWKFNYKRDSVLSNCEYESDGYLSDHGVWTGIPKSPKRSSYKNDTNAMFSSLKAAERWVECSKEARREHESKVYRMWGQMWPKSVE